MTKKTKRQLAGKVLALFLKLNDLSNEIEELSEVLDQLGELIDDIPITKED